jgi:ABC-type uncharacterized transport system ATPase subunit
LYEPIGSLDSVADGYAAILSDVWGVVHNGEEAFPEASAALMRARQKGIAVVLISHRMPDVFDVADRVIVMRRGRKVADKRIASSSPEEVTGLITGAIEQV